MNASSTLLASSLALSLTLVPSLALAGPPPPPPTEEGVEVLTPSIPTDADEVEAFLAG